MRQKLSIARYLLFFATALLLTGCLEDTLQETGVYTEQQINNAPDNTRTEALLKGLAARFHADGSNSFDHYAFGYGAIMHIRDVQTGDMSIAYSDYDQFIPWERNVNMGSNSVFTQYIWYYYYQSIHACNNVLAKISNTNDASDLEKGTVGAAHAFRALFYLDLARMYEFLPNDIYPVAVNERGHDITGLTVPIITENTIEADARKIPRATRDSMYRFILADLDTAEVLIKKLDNTYYATDHTLPHIYSVWGLKARLYMWMEDYKNAYTAAINAQDEWKKVVTWEDTSTNIKGAGSGSIRNSGTIYYDQYGYATGDYHYTGYNTPEVLMWCDTQTSDNSTVTGGLCNWTSWMTPEASFGYAHLGPKACISMDLYNRISDDDWLKRFYIINSPTHPDGTSVKFAPGNMEYDDYLYAAATSYPVMRVEEMMLIEAEAAARQNARAGLGALVDYMNTYRMNTANGYTYKGEMTQQGIINEIIVQKRIELWGEGQAFFDIKRANLSVTRGYKGTNFYEQCRFNTNGRPAWMNYCIVLNEENNNDSIRGRNNPDPSDKYGIWAGE